MRLAVSAGLSRLLQAVLLLVMLLCVVVVVAVVVVVMCIWVPVVGFLLVLLRPLATMLLLCGADRPRFALNAAVHAGTQVQLNLLVDASYARHQLTGGEGHLHGRRGAQGGCVGNRARHGSGDAAARITAVLLAATSSRRRSLAVISGCCHT